MVPLIGTMRMFRRFAGGLGPFLAETVDLPASRRIIRDRLARREARFLHLAERGIFGHPRSPYLPLLAHAGCTLEDLSQLVRRRGLDEALLTLRRQGVYVSCEEFKGREPIRRGSLSVPVAGHDFDNPFTVGCYAARTGGTTGAGARISTDLDFLAEQAPYERVSLAALGLDRTPVALWYGILPEGTGINNILRMAKVGNPVSRWFLPRGSGGPSPLVYGLANRAIGLMARRHGLVIPRPEPVGLEESPRIARWMHEAIRREGSCLLRTTASRSLRVSRAAREGGLDLTGGAFMGGSEPVTPGKRREIEACGARFLCSYAFVEAGRVGSGCLEADRPDQVHLHADLVALVTHPRPVPGWDLEVDSFHFTTLSPAASKIMLNVEMDDHGTVEHRECGCPFGELGLRTHLSDIRSFRKLTGEGVCLVGSDAVRILDQDLPARFGGSPLDYQLVEEEDEGGLTRLSLLIHPRLGPLDETEAARAVTAGLRRRGYGSHLAASLWDEAGTIRVTRCEPSLTARGKHLPLRQIRRAAPPTTKEETP